MQYMGGKHRIRKQIATTLFPYTMQHKYYIEPFVGGFNITWALMEMGINIPVAALDISQPLISMYKAVQTGWAAPTALTRDEYYNAMELPDTDPLKGFAGYLCSFGGKYFGGYAQATNKQNYVLNGHRAIEKRRKYIERAVFRCSDYRKLTTLSDTLIYCDPPYINMTGYKYNKGFDHTIFWNWVREMSRNNTVIVSEYTAPDDFKCIKEIYKIVSLGSAHNGYCFDGMERLFKVKG